MTDDRAPHAETELEDELVEIVDEDGRVVGVAPRARCHGDPALRHRAVHVVVRDGAGRVFLQRRSRRKRIQPGRWDTSVGGHVDPGESFLEAAARELAEELGVVLASHGFPATEGALDGELGGPVVLRHLYDYEWRSDVETELVRTYELRHAGPFRLHPEEIDEGRFFTPDELLAACGTGRLTPNLEEELRLLGILDEAPRVKVRRPAGGHGL